MQNTELKAVDFFCGAGGVTCGFSNAGIKVLGGIDIDSSCKITYETNNVGSQFIEADISKYAPLTLQQELQLQQNDDNLIFIGCSPCQYYSIINTSREKAEKGKMLLDEFRRFVAYFRPGYIFIENVPGIERKEKTPLSSFKDFLGKNGYTWDDKIINAAYYDVPQNRKRYVLIATRLTSEINISKPSLEQQTARATLQRFPPIPAGHKDDNSNLMHWAANLQPINIHRLSVTPHDGGTRHSWKDKPHLQLDCYRDKDHMFRDVYGRMFWDAPSPTITTKFTSISNGRFAHPDQNRGISLREGACLQSFPDHYVFHSDSLASVARMIGNAVPPKMATKIGEGILANWKRFRETQSTNVIVESH